MPLAVFDTNSLKAYSYFETTKEFLPVEIHDEEGLVN
jgi:hypothetical protein